MESNNDTTFTRTIFLKICNELNDIRKNVENTKWEPSIKSEVIKFADETINKIRYTKYIIHDYNSNNNNYIQSQLNELYKNCSLLSELFNKKTDKNINIIEVENIINRGEKIVNDLFLNSFAMIDEIYENSFKTLLEAEIKSKQFITDESTLISKVNRLENRVSENFEKQKNVERTINKAFTDTEQYLNQQGLSHSFYERGTSLKHQAWIWLFFLVCSLYAIYFFTIYYIPIPDLKNISYEDLNIYLRANLLRLPAVIALFWLAWFCSKKQFYYNKLWDDYNFKNDLSKAYYGYKKEAMGLEIDNDKQLEIQLLRGVLNNIAKNPVESTPQESNSPYSECISSITKLIKNIKKD